jgi:adenylate cyclase
MGVKYKRRELDKIRFSIGAKLITIISILVILSLGSITVLVSLLVQADLRISAEENNFEMNRRSAMEAETMLINVRSNSRILIQTVTSMGPQTPEARQAVDFFFAENPQVAAVFFVIPGRSEYLLVNERFFLSREMYLGLAASFFQNQREVFGRTVRGETLLHNATPHFARAMLALLFPSQNGGVGGVLFSSDGLNENFGFGINQSYMLNSDGDILSHPDSALVRAGTNIAELEFVNNILNSSERSRQQLIEADFGVLETALRAPAGIFPNIPNITSMIFPETDADKGMLTRKFVAFTKLNVAGAIVITSIEYNKVFEGVFATTRRNIYLTIAVLSISIIFVWFFSKTISIPLRGLARAARQIEGGKFDLQLTAKSKDEIGVLTSSFQKMCSALNVFGRFTNKEIAVKAMRGEIKPGGLPKHGTVFFSDIREFTAKSEAFTKHFGMEASDKIVHWLNTYFTEMVDCVEKTHGVVDKFIGDAVMAHWGTAYSAGSPRKDAFNAIKASLMMRKALYFLNRSRRSGDPAFPLIRIGCGLNSGIITAGQLGSDLRMEYTVIGDPVNLASRIEALTKPLGADILISEDTWKLVGDRFICEEMPSVTVKGKAKPVRIFAVVNFMGEPKGPQTLAEVRSLLGIEPPKMEEVDVNADEKKYAIGEG